MTLYRIVETDNFGGDYAAEQFVNIPSARKDKMELIACALNSVFCNDPDAPRFWKVVDADYKLIPGFEP